MSQRAGAAKLRSENEELLLGQVEVVNGRVLGASV